MILLIDSYLVDSLALAKYARAEMLTFQQKYSEAIESFADLIAKDNSLCVEAGQQSANLLLTLNRSSEAVDILSQVLDFYPENDQKDELVFLMAKAQHMAGSYREALDLYLDILDKYPNSLFYEESRSRARELNTLLKKEQI